MINNEPADIKELFDILSDETQTLPAALIYRLSQPANTDFEQIKALWAAVPVERRRLLIARLVETSESSFEFNFDHFALHALSDEDAEVRTNAIEVLWENNRPETMQQLLRLLTLDEAAMVRAKAASELGRFINAAELEEFPETLAGQALDALEEVWLSDGEELEVRRRALEGLSWSSREEVGSFIEEAVADARVEMRASALFAMGCNGHERWESYVLDALLSGVPELRFEATRAAGELGLVAAVPRLIELSREQDREIMEMAIWSLGEIGGQEAQQRLFEMMDEDHDPALSDLLEDATSMAALNAGEFSRYILDFDDDDFDEDLDLLDL